MAIMTTSFYAIDREDLMKKCLDSNGRICVDSNGNHFRNRILGWISSCSEAKYAKSGSMASRLRDQVTHNQTDLVYLIGYVHYFRETKNLLPKIMLVLSSSTLKV